MKAITLWQPMASLLACGAKQFETRSWATNYRGPIAIHAAKTDTHWWGDCNKDYLRAVFAALKPVYVPDVMCNQTDLQRAAPYGAVVATADLVGCWEMRDEGRDIYFYRENAALNAKHSEVWVHPSETELLFGDWQPGRYAWEFVNIKMLDEPIPAKGGQRIWNWGDSI